MGGSVCRGYSVGGSVLSFRVTVCLCVHMIVLSGVCVCAWLYNVGVSIILMYVFVKIGVPTTN